MRGDKIMAEISLHAFKAKDTWFVTDWLKSKGLHKLCSVFEGIQKPFTLSLACKSVVSWSIKPCLHTQLPEHNKSYRKVSRGWGHLITWHGLIFSASGGGNLNKNFPKIQMPGGLPGGEGMLTLRFDWYIKQRKSQAWRRFGYPVLISIDFDDFTGFAKSRPAACGPRPTMARRPNAQRPTTCSGPEAQSWFSTVFCPAVNPCACTGLHRVWACKMDNGEFEFVYYYYYNIKQSFRSFHSLHVATWKMFSFSVYLSVYKTQVHSQRGKIFSNHSLRLKISY